MLTVFPLVLFTVFVQIAAGLCIFSLGAGFRSRGALSAPFRRGWLHAALMAALGLVFALFGRQAGGLSAALAPPAWMSLSGLLTGLCAALSFLAWQSAGRLRAAVPATLAGLSAVFVQAWTYTPSGVSFSLSGLLPLCLFTLGTLALGASFAGYGFSSGDRNGNDGAEISVLRLSLAGLLLVFLLVPGLGGSGDALMQVVSLAWMESLPHWAAVMAAAVALGVSFMGRGARLVWALLTLTAVVCSRIAFFADGIHLAAGFSFGG